MLIRHYPVVISEDTEHGTYNAICPDLDLAIAIHGVESKIEAAGFAFAQVHMYTAALKQMGKPLPPATSMEEAGKLKAENVIMIIGVTVCQTEEGDNFEAINAYNTT